MTPTQCKYIFFSIGQSGRLQNKVDFMRQGPYHYFGAAVLMKVRVSGLYFLRFIMYLVLMIVGILKGIDMLRVHGGDNGDIRLLTTSLEWSTLDEGIYISYFPYISTGCLDLFLRGLQNWIWQNANLTSIFGWKISYLMYEYNSYCCLPFQ